METHKIIAQLIVKYQTGNLDEQEWQMLQEWISRSERSQKLFKRLADKAYWEKIKKIDLEEQWRKVVEPSPVTPVRTLTKRRVYRLAGAACIIALLAVSIMLLLKKNSAVQIIDSSASRVQNDSISNPLLLLANGSIIELTRSVMGPVASIDGWAVKNRNMQVSIDPNPVSYFSGYNKSCAGLLYNNTNMLITPKGCTYFITLPDGTEIELNGGSVLKFPSQFESDQRTVEMSGEAYFKVKPYYDKGREKKVPFCAIVNKMQVAVLGTEFNIKTYNGSDSIKTTLVKGSVRLMMGSEHCILKPGEEVALNKNGQFSKPKVVNVNEVKAWKAVAKFENAPIEEIMEHISRVFNVTVIYINKPRKLFNVYLTPTDSLAEVLKMVDLAGGVKFRIDGTNVFVTQ